MTEQPQVNNLLTLRLLWVGFLFAVVLYNIIVRSINLLNANMTEINPLFLQILTGLSVVIFIAIIVIQVKVGNTLPDDVSSVFVIKLFQFALAESIAIYGLVLTFMDGNTQRLLYFSIASALGLLAAYPRR